MNQVSGPVSGTVVQAGVISGSVHIHAAAEPVVPRQLPVVPATFVGRSAERNALDELLPDDPATGRSVVISSLGGVGGIGKTWLAVRWAHDHVARFPDGQLFVDLRGFSPDGEPMSSETAVRGFLDALGVDADGLPSDPHALSARFRTSVADRRMLIILDNAVSTEQVAPLLPGGSACTVLVTSRNHLTGLQTAHGAQHVVVDVLSEADALALLERKLGRDRVAAEPRAVAELLAYCAGLPLALSIVVSRSSMRPRARLSDLVGELLDTGLTALAGDDPVASLPTVLSWSVAALAEEQRRAFALLGLAPGPDTSLPAAAALLGVDVGEARRILFALEEASLLTTDGRGRYAMHDLVRHYAAGLAPEGAAEDPDAAVRRILDFYLHTAHRGDRALYPHSTSIALDPPATGVRALTLTEENAMAWFEAEHACLLAAQRTASARELYGQTWQLAWAMDTYLHRRGRLDDYLAVWQLVRASADRLDDESQQALAARRLGHALARLRRWDAAMSHLDAALALASAIGDVENQANTHRIMAWVQGAQHHYARACAHAQDALRLYRSMGSGTREADALNTVGWYLAKQGRYGEALAHCQEALTLQLRHGDRDGTAATLDSLGHIAHQTGENDLAIDYYRQALALRREQGNAYEEANTLEGMSAAYVTSGRAEEARAAQEQALELFEAQGRTADAARVRAALEASP
ncbi:tetratricopeptide repeat protein [Amycolatopsis sp. NPDC049159]|uniref:ATP-binding protein n=1 Tax=Amycolatopsis sp. NPDC049159 TaxID=3157210 RepID=UPI0033E83D32